MNVEGVEGMTGAEAADGRGECRKVVRRQIGAGADWIKVQNIFNNNSPSLILSFDIDLWRSVLSDKERTH